MAQVFYEQGDKWISHTVNHGELIQPLRNITELNLKNLNNKLVPDNELTGKWTLLLVLPGACQASCQKMLYDMRQIRLASGKDRNRIQRAVITFSITNNKDLSQRLKIFAGTEHWLVSEPKLQSVMANLNSTAIAMKEGYLYLVDPLGNIMMGYKLEANPMDIYKDLQKLLAVSQIG